MAVFMFFPDFYVLSKWGLLFDERRGLTSTGHFPSTGE
jgi:hypothetical protein